MTFPTGLVPRLSTLVRAGTATPLNQTSTWLLVPLIRTRTWASCQTPTGTLTVLTVATFRTSFW